jgi:CPA2 family monovalent cation:H+ antiporter-2
MTMDFHLLLQKPLLVTQLVLALMMGKAVLLTAICTASKMRFRTSLHTSLLLSQGGEFAFILFGMGKTFGLLTAAESQLLVVVVAVSMALTPLAYWLGGFISKKLAAKTPTPSQDIDPSLVEASELYRHVVIIGYGRVGQTVGKLLAAEGINYTALDTDAFIVTKAREKGRPVYFGDGTRREVLQAVSLEQARAAVVTTHDFYSANKAVVALKNLAPNVPVIARGQDLQHLQKLEMAGADVAIAEKFEASLQLGGAVMKKMQVPDHEINRILDLFRERDYALTRLGEVSRSGQEV